LQCAHPNQPIAVIAEGNIARWRPSVINRMEKTPSAGFPDACNGAPVPKQCEAVARLGEAVLVLIRNRKFEYQTPRGGFPNPHSFSISDNRVAAVPAEASMGELVICFESGTDGTFREDIINL